MAVIRHWPESVTLAMCEDTGVMATGIVGGECQVHGGDACLRMVQYVLPSHRGAVEAFEELRAVLSDVSAFETQHARVYRARELVNAALDHLGGQYENGKEGGQGMGNIEHWDELLHALAAIKQNVASGHRNVALAQLGFTVREVKRLRDQDAGAVDALCDAYVCLTFDNADDAMVRVREALEAAGVDPSTYRGQ